MTRKMNAVRSGIVVVGALAFGWLSLQVGFKPFLEKAQRNFPESRPSAELHDAHTFSDSSSREEFDTLQLAKLIEEHRNQLAVANGGC